MNAYAHPRASILTFLVVFFAFMVLSWQMVRPYLLAVLMGGIIAILCRPLYLRIKGNKKRSKTASTLVTLLFLFCVLIPTGVFTFLSIRQGISIGHSITNNEDLSFKSITNAISEWPIIQNYVGDTAELERQLKDQVRGVARILPASVLSFLGSTPEFILQLALTFIACFFLMIDGPHFIKWIFKKIPLDPVTRERLSKSMKDTTISVILATIASASAQASIMLVSYLVLGIPAAFLAGGATFILAWIPMVGSTPVWTIGAIYLFVKGSVGKAIAMLLLGFFTGVIDNFIRPIVLKGRNEMHPLVSLVAIFGGINMFGILGVFVGPIIAAILISLFDVLPGVIERLGDEERDASGAQTHTTGNEVRQKNAELPPRAH